MVLELVKRAGQGRVGQGRTGGHGAAAWQGSKTTLLSLLEGKLKMVILELVKRAEAGAKPLALKAREAQKRWLWNWSRGQRQGQGGAGRGSRAGQVRATGRRFWNWSRGRGPLSEGTLNPKRRGGQSRADPGFQGLEIGA